MVNIIIVKERPVSANSSRRNKTRWRRTVAAEAKKVYSTPMSDMDLNITITFFYEAFPDFDSDNISKPICDALKGIAYHDDKQLLGRYVHRRDINGSFTLENPELEVIDAIKDGKEFVCITIKKADLGVVKI